MKRIFNFEDQNAFAKLSGDYNPIHIDKIAARRMIFGMPIVHGIHALLWCLDSWLMGKTKILLLNSINVYFNKPIGLDEEVSLLINNESKRCVRIDLLNCDLIVMMSVIIRWDSLKIQDLPLPLNYFPEKFPPRMVLTDDIIGKSGELDLYLNVKAATKNFPNLLACISPLQIAVFLSLSRLVSVECPGLHSLFSELSLSFRNNLDYKYLNYEITNYNKKLSLVFIKVKSPIMTGQIRAFHRPNTLKQESYKKLKDLVSSTEFTGWRAMLIGGSRGLGEVCAKLLAAGGAEVLLTYNKGKEDALYIVDDINKNGGVAKCLHFDVLSIKHQNFISSLNNWFPTHLFYFATPFIFSGVKGVFSTDQFNKFCHYYVNGFQNCTNILINLGLRNIFYPSTLAISELQTNMSEYTVAKTAGEMLCLFLQKNNSDLKIYKPRLPRMSTDQTVTLFPIKNEDPVPIMLRHLQAFQSISK